jgi:hypothetical protein
MTWFIKNGHGARDRQNKAKFWTGRLGGVGVSIRRELAAEIALGSSLGVIGFSRIVMLRPVANPIWLGGTCFRFRVNV